MVLRHGASTSQMCSWLQQSDGSDRQKLHVTLKSKRVFRRRMIIGRDGSQTSARPSHSSDPKILLPVQRSSVVQLLMWKHTLQTPPGHIFTVSARTQWQVSPQHCSNMIPGGKERCSGRTTESLLHKPGAPPDISIPISWPRSLSSRPSAAGKSVFAPIIHWYEEKVWGKSQTDKSYWSVGDEDERGEVSGGAAGQQPVSCLCRRCLDRARRRRNPD